MLTPAWGLFTDQGELVATIRHPTKQGACNRFAKAHMHGDFVRELPESGPGGTEIPLWIRLLREEYRQ